jgi:uncharacterized membrane protein YfcA
MVLLDVLILRRYRLQWPGWTAPCVGLASGLLTGAFNIGGPPLVAYVYAQPGSKREHVGTLSMVFIMGGIVRLAMMLTHETVAPRIWGAAGLTILPMLAAVYYGHWLLHFVSQRVLRAAVYTALFFLGIRYLISVS